MKVTFWLNEEKEIEGINILSVKKHTPLDFFNKIVESIENELPESLPTNEAYKAKLKHRYERDGAGVQYFDGYEIVSLVKCTPI
jgi:hypothetical protein